MTTHHDDLDQLLRPWMQRHAPDAPNELVLRIIGEIETMSEHAPTRSWLSRFSTWPASAWGAAAAALVVIAIAIGVLYLNLVGTPTPANQPTPSPRASAADPTAVADALITTWNAGDGHAAVALYGPSANPLVRLMIDSATPTTELVTTADVESYLATWHARGSVLTRTGSVQVEGPFAVYPVTWTSNDGSFDGMSVIRISAAGLVSEQYLMGATASGTSPQVDAAQLVNDLRDASNASDGTAASSLFDTQVAGQVIEDGAMEGGLFRTGLTQAIDNGTACCETNGGILTQGPFIAHTDVVTNPTLLPGVEVEGIEVLEVNGSGLIRDIWRFDTRVPLPGSPAPGASGG